MNWKLIITFITFLFHETYASRGCMDNSWHLEKPFDTKDYHIVGRKVGKYTTFCPCPCRKLSFNRGQCLECGHRHDIQPLVIIRAARK